MKKNTFTGPIFIVGRPRSGTKLLMSLLNGHSQISIPYLESNFIPKYINKFHEFGNIENYSNFVNLCEFLKKIKFFIKINNHPKYSGILDCNQWYLEVKDYNYSGVISAFFKMYAKRGNKSIWGDKSPGYMFYMKELKKLFPESKFIYIIRDVRDNCLSIANTWNWSPYRAAQLCNDCIKKCRIDSQSYLNNDYFEIKFENLLENPEVELKKLCNFLNVSFEKSMMTLKGRTEEFGDAKYVIGIMAGNKNKWKTKMPEDMIRKIETISYEMLKALNYDVVFANSSQRLAYWKIIFYRYKDALNRLKFDYQHQGGFLKTIKYRYMKKRFG